MPTALAGGRYQLGQLIGRGGMAEVHVALDTRLGRTVAVKIMRADLANDDIFLARFRREAHAVAQMNNPNIVNIYDSGEELVSSESGDDRASAIHRHGIRQGPDPARHHQGQRRTQPARLRTGDVGRA